MMEQVKHHADVEIETMLKLFVSFFLFCEDVCLQDIGAQRAATPTSLQLQWIAAATT